MKIKQGFILRKIFNEYTVFSTGADNRNEPVTINLNETAACIWKKLEKGVNTKLELIQTVLNNYAVDFVTAEKAVDYVLNILNEADCLE